MKRSLRFVLAFCLTASTACAADLGTDVRAVLRDSLLVHAKYGVKLVRLADGGHPQVLFESSATLPLVPASNLKVITTSAALQRLGPDFKFRTLLLQHGSDLVLVGDGDPTLGDAELLKKSGWDVRTVFQTWAAALAKRHLGPVSRLLVDDSVFDDQFLNPHWPADQAQKHYVAEVGGLNLNVNCLDFYVRPTRGGQTVSFITDPPTNYATIKNTCVSGESDRIWLSRDLSGNEIILRGEASQANDQPVSVTIHDPPLYAGTVLAETFSAAGISIGEVSRDRSQRQQYLQAVSQGQRDWTLLAVHQTALTEVMARANKDSLNLYAECCCKRLGFAATGEGSWANGVATVGSFLQDIGVAAEEFHLDDGCGLSKDNGISANLMTRVLEHDFYGPNSRAFMDTLAIAGVDGTMEDRFRGSDLRGRVHAKSGFVNGVSCLSGYLNGRDGNWYAFSILFNDVPAGATGQAKTLEERIVRAVDVDTVK